jgi:hypothetical protein
MATVAAGEVLRTEMLRMERADTIFIDNQIQTGIGAEFNGIGGTYGNERRKAEENNLRKQQPGICN